MAPWQRYPRTAVLYAQQAGRRHHGEPRRAARHRAGAVPREPAARPVRVGRLDKDTEGLLLVTDDGALSHALMSPSRHVSKVYEAELDGVLVPDAAERFAPD